MIDYKISTPRDTSEKKRCRGYSTRKRAFIYMFRGIHINIYIAPRHRDTATHIYISRALSFLCKRFCEFMLFLVSEFLKSYIFFVCRCRGVLVSQSPYYYVYK